MLHTLCHVNNTCEETRFHQFQIKFYFCMNNAYVMSASFEARKNQQATMITAGFAGLLVLFMFLIKWQLVSFTPLPPLEEGIEVNLGTSDQGFGKDQPLMPGDPAPKAEVIHAAPPVTKVANDDS